jgi:hypothetical protein
MEDSKSLKQRSSKTEPEKEAKHDEEEEEEISETEKTAKSSKSEDKIPKKKPATSTKTGPPAPSRSKIIAI